MDQQRRPGPIWVDGISVSKEGQHVHTLEGWRKEGVTINTRSPPPQTRILWRLIAQIDSEFLLAM